jgi:hypothetical protein
MKRRDMRIEFCRTGGVAGIRLTATLDTKKLPPQEAARLRRLISAACFFDQPPSLKSATSGADRFQYLVTVKEGDRKKKVEIDESCVPRPFQPLIDYLLDSCRARRRTKRP